MAVRQEFLDLFARRAAEGFPAISSVPLEHFRRLALPDPTIHGRREQIHQVEDRFIVGPSAYLPVRIYRPSAAANLPAMVFFHGGGWVTSTVDHYDQALSNFANLLNTVVIAVTYQKAPEHPFPIPFDDCYATLKWVVDNNEMLEIDLNKIGVAGDSAGGNLAAAVALKARDESLVTLAYQLLIYPATDPTLDSDSAKRNATGYGLTRDSMFWYLKQYIQDEKDLQNPYAWPALARTHTNLPPAVVMTASYDVLYDDGLAYAKKLQSAGVEVTHINYEDAIHGCLVLAGLSDFSHTLQSDLAQAVARYL